MTQPHAAFLSKLQRRTAQAAIGSSALRNQGAPGVISAARDGLARISLRDFSSANAATFRHLVDRATTKLVSTFPTGAKNWGAARKAVNLYLRDVVYNRDLCLQFDLARIRPWLEVPLDKDVGTALCREREGKHLPEWDSIKRLDPSSSAAFQQVAAKVSKRRRVCRVDLDIYYWRP
jgi:hypothetical protein